MPSDNDSSGGLIGITSEFNGGSPFFNSVWDPYIEDIDILGRYFSMQRYIDTRNVYISGAVSFEPEHMNI